MLAETGTDIPVIQTKIVAIIFMLLLAIPLHSPDSLKVNALESVQLLRSPQQVSSMQPVLVYAFYNGTFGSLKLRVTADIDTSVSRTGIVDIPNPAPRTIDITMVPAGWASNWYVAGIPGLPSTTVSASIESGIGIYRQVISFTITVTSKVTYTLLVDGSAKGSDSYTVLEGGLERKAPPLVFAAVYETINDPSIIRETLGLGPKGWSLSSQLGLKTLIVATDDKGEQGLSKVLFEYSATSAPWIQTALNDDPIMDTVRSFSSTVNNDLNEVKGKIRTVKSDFDLPTIAPALSIKNALIPAQAAGNYVRFRANATDVDGNKASSPMGLYYTVNKASSTRILIIDPHVWLWLYKENTFQFVDTINRNVDYSAPSDLTNRIKPALKTGQAARDNGFEPFHHWEYLGENYDLYIAYPNSKLTDQLNQRWNIFILSNLWLGYSQDDTKEPWDWDLIDLGIFGKISDYVRANHTGIVATHGTLSDWMIWKSCNEKQKVGTRGHIGDNIGDINILKESTVAGLLGIPHLALFEVARDTVAQSLCSITQTSLLGRAVGSTPLQVPYAPFNGTMKVADGIRDLGWNLPQEFTINTPSLYSQFGMQSYTQVGWQLAMPSELVSPTWKKADEARTSADRFYQKLSVFMENATNLRAPSSDIRRNLGDSLSNRLRDLHNSIVSASINGTKFDIAVKVPETNQATKLSLDVKDVYNQLLQMSPVKLAAISRDSLAGIITHDKYWDRNGHRSVYFSFEPESSEGTIAKTLLLQAMEWSMKWEFKDISTLLGNAVRITKEKATKFNDGLAKQKGMDRFSSSVILNEMGGTVISISVSSPTKLNLLIVHPTSDKISVNASSSAEIIGTPKVADRVTSLALKVSKPGNIVITLKADPDSALNPAYLVVREESFDFSISVSQSSLSITQGSSATTSFNLMSTQGISQQTSLLVSGLPSGVTTSFSPTTGTPNFTSTITLATSSTTPAGIYAVTVSGTAGGNTHSVTFTLNILSMMVPPQPAPQPVPQPAPQPQPVPQPLPGPQPQQPVPQPAPAPAPAPALAPQPQPPAPQREPVAPLPAPELPPAAEQQPPPAVPPVPAPVPEQPPPNPIPAPRAATDNGTLQLGLPVILGAGVAIAIGIALAIRFRKKP